MANQFPKDINYYQLLQVDPCADSLVIKSAYYTLLNQLKAHPDKGGDEEEAKRINEAYNVLSTQRLRREYDAFLTGSRGPVINYNSNHHMSESVPIRRHYTPSSAGFHMEDPFRNHHPFDNLLNQFLGIPNRSDHHQPPTPPVRILKTSNRWIIKIEIPGVRWEDVGITTENNTLTVSGQRKRISTAGETVLDEFRYGLFSRTFRLPADAALEKIRASMADGYLEVVIPFSSQNNSITIPITEC